MRAGLVLLALMSASPALAGTFQAPEGCKTVMTLQARGCYVANYYRCEAEPGHLWRVDFDQQGPFFQSHTDDEAQWLESFDLAEGTVQRLDPNPRDPASFSALIDTGYDSFAFALSKDNGEHSNVRGFDRLTGLTRDLNGVTLEQTEYDYEETDDEGNILRRSRGKEWILRGERTFIAGLSEWWDGETWLPMDASPVSLSFPGDKGYEATEPLFDCDAVMSALPQAEVRG